MSFLFGVCFALVKVLSFNVLVFESAGVQVHDACLFSTHSGVGLMVLLLLDVW